MIFNNANTKALRELVKKVKHLPILSSTPLGESTYKLHIDYQRVVARDGRSTFKKHEPIDEYVIGLWQIFGSSEDVGFILTNEAKNYMEGVFRLPIPCPVFLNDEGKMLYNELIELIVFE